MRWIVVFALFCLTGVASAQVQVGRVRVSAEETGCWSNSHAPCEDIGESSLHVGTSGRAARIRIVNVEARSTRSGSAWVATAGEFHLLVGRQTVAGAGATLAPRRSHHVEVFFTPVRMLGDAMVRTTLEVDGQRVTVEAPHAVVYEHPDPEL